MKKEMILSFIDFKFILCCLLTYLKFSAFKQMQNGCRAGKKKLFVKIKELFHRQNSLKSCHLVIVCLN